MTSGPFRVRFSGLLKDELLLLRTAATALGVAPRLAHGMMEIERSLIANPKTWGDPLRHLESLKVTLHHRIFDELLVEYSVHDTEKIVWLSRTSRSSIIL